MPYFHNAYAISTPQNLPEVLVFLQGGSMLFCNGREIFQKERADKNHRAGTGNGARQASRQNWRLADGTRMLLQPEE